MCECYPLQVFVHWLLTVATFLQVMYAEPVAAAMSRVPGHVLPQHSGPRPKPSDSVESAARAVLLSQQYAGDPHTYNASPCCVLCLHPRPHPMILNKENMVELDDQACRGEASNQSTH